MGGSWDECAMCNAVEPVATESRPASAGRTLLKSTIKQCKGLKGRSKSTA